MAIGKVLLVAAVLLLIGSKLVPHLLLVVARTRSTELFTLSVLVLALVIATISSSFFGVSLALGAFLAGIVVGYSRLSVQAAADALPMRDAFAVLFFVSIGMLFEPAVAADHLPLLLAVAAVVLVIKPLGAFLITFALGTSVVTGLTVALGIAQVGEFTFIMAALGRKLGVLPGEGYTVLVAAALLSISLNPLLIRAVRPLERALERRPKLWRFLSWRAEARARRHLPVELTVAPEVIIVGYGPVGRNVHRIAQDFGVRAVVIETNPDTVNELFAKEVMAIFGDAARREVLLAAGVARARYLVVTLPDLLARISIITAARLEAPDIEIITRARYLQEREILLEAGASTVSFEEAEAAVSLASAMLLRIGANPEAITAEAERIRQELGSCAGHCG